MHLGLAGNPVSHSFSPFIFNRIFKQYGIKGRYDLFEVESAEELFRLFIDHPLLIGLNVTIPFKQSVIPYLNELDSGAVETLSVNVIKKMNGEWFKGFNTDVIGFEALLKSILSYIQNRRALILGTGGSSQSVAWVLRKNDFEIMFVSRTSTPNILSYNQLSPNLLAGYPLIVNTTPCGMFGYSEGIPPFPIDFIHKNHFLIDLVYNPPVTPLIHAFRNKGALAVNGLRMLLVQAYSAYNIFVT